MGEHHEYLFIFIGTAKRTGLIGGSVCRHETCGFKGDTSGNEYE
jgi:hypothetical protein